MTAAWSSEVVVAGGYIKKNVVNSPYVSEDHVVSIFTIQALKIPSKRWLYLPDHTAS
jgi:hypothetical protein